MRTPPRQARGFTLVELLVVIGIIAVLITVVTIVASGAFKAADKVRLGAQLQTIEQALEAYKTLFGAYPVTAPVDTVAGNGDDFIGAVHFRGARTLCKALLGQTPQQSNPGTAFTFNLPNQDGKEGFGFRVPPRSGQFRTTGAKLPDGTTNELAGEVSGPFLAPDKFKISNMARVDDTTKNLKVGDLDVDNRDYDDTCVILDANGRPILYYPVLNPQPNIALLNSYVGDGPTATSPLPMYRYEDNDYEVGAPANPIRSGLDEDEFRRALGDANVDGMIGAGETPAVRGKYILWSAGPDGIFGRNATAAKASDKLDDVTNFQQ